MSRFHQRLQDHLKNEDVASGFAEMGAESELLQALNEARERLAVSRDELAARIGHLDAVETEVDPTLTTITRTLQALGVTAEITLRRSSAGEAPIRVTTTV